MTSAGKNIHEPVLANPHSLDWRIFGQNPDVCLPCFLESCRTSGALVEPNLCDYVCYVVEKRPRRLAKSPIIRLRTPAINSRFRMVFVGGRIVLLDFNTIVCTRGCYWTRLQRCCQMDLCAPLWNLCGLSLRQTGLR